VYVTFGPTASTALFSIRLTANTFYDGAMGDYTGPISAIRASGTSQLMVTEITTT